MKNKKLTIYLLAGIAIMTLPSRSFAEETNKIYKWQIGKFAKHQDQMQENIKGGLTKQEGPKDKADIYHWQMEMFPKNMDQFNLNFTPETPVTNLIHSDDELFRWQISAFAKNHPSDPTADESFKESQANDSNESTK